MFKNLSGSIKNEKFDKRLKTSITEHLLSFEAEFKRYFSEPKEQEAAFVRNPFSTALDELQDQFCDLQNDSSAHDDFQEIAISQFWCAMHESYPSYPLISELTFRRKVGDDTRLALSNTKPQISTSAVRLLSQPLH